jgi:uncharacterized protein (DUF1684 family)
MRIFTIIIFMTAIQPVLAQVSADSAKAEVTRFQEELDNEYADPQHSPLGPKAAKKFKGHAFFPVDLSYRVLAKLLPTPTTTFFDMKTTTSRFAEMRIYGYLVFELQGKSFNVPVYQSKSLKTSDYDDHLFFPFHDLTNRTATYPGGRYIDLHIPKTGEQIVLDFNQAYNPYCAYSERYSCPIVPKENFLNILVKAGVMYGKKTD